MSSLPECACRSPIESVFVRAILLANWAREHWGSQNFVSVSANERPLRRSAPPKYGQEVKVHIRCSKIERGERAVDCFSLAIKLHRKLPDAHFLFDEYHEIALKTKAKH
jgi:hypothetical protein